MDKATERSIEKILNRNRVLTLATMRPDRLPQATVVTFAHDKLTPFVAVDATSQKARNIRRNDKVSLAMGQDKRDWSRITGRSMAAQARVLRPRDEIEWAQALLTKRSPQMNEMGTADDYAGWAFIEVIPLVISVLDYTLGAGHTELVKLGPKKAMRR
jgi:nitroimidazol reductase NimA-like FMN-containing flavoprotein (pyridoxamine 5'-phosphate oxidase superfamily)